MNLISYTVRCTFTDHSVAPKWLEWLEQEHLQEVLDGGAHQAVVYQMDGEDLTYEIRYEFLDRNKFDEYEQKYAPELRKKGLDRFPLSLGLEYQRTVATAIAKAQTS